MFGSSKQAAGLILSIQPASFGFKDLTYPQFPPLKQDHSPTSNSGLVRVGDLQQNAFRSHTISAATVKQYVFDEELLV